VAGLDDLNSILRVTASGVRGASASGILRPSNPAVALRITRELRTWGSGPALGFALGACRRPDDLAIIDVDDPLHPEVSFSDIEHRCNALAWGLIDRGVTEHTTVGLLARNSRAYVEVMVAVSRIGADLVYFDTDTSAGAIKDAVAEHHISMMVRNSAFASRCPADLSWLGTDDPAGVSLLDALPIRGKLTPPEDTSRHYLAVAGGGHAEVADLGLRFEAFAGLLDVLPLRLSQTHLIAAPICSSWGWLHHRLASTLGATEVLVRQPEPERLLALIQSHEVSVLVTTASALAQILDLPLHVRQRYDVDTLSCVAVDSPLPPSLSEAALGFFGDIVYVGFGTSTTAVVTIAEPDDLHRAPATAGRPLPGTRVAIVDDDGTPVSEGIPGWVRVEVRGNAVADSTPTWGHLDEHGRLTVLPAP
jgi:acyl-CoA synthetase (AMP-forming)/AMP-acid ligase II